MSRQLVRLPWSGLAIPVIAALAVACSASSVTPQGTTSGPQHHEPPPTRAAPQPYPGTTFENPGLNPATDPSDDPYSTFALDVDTASWGVARRFIEDGRLPDPDSVRVEEYVNAFPGGYETPRDATFAIHVDGSWTPFTGRDAVLVRVGLQSRAVPDRLRAPVSLTFVIDTSGSMGTEGRLETVKAAFRTLVDGLGEDDSVAIVRFSNEARIVLRPTSAAERDAILDAIDGLQPEGSTNVQAGLELGFDLADEENRHWSGRDHGDRVILASDGVANVGLTDADSLLERIDRQVAAGIDLVSVGVGMGNFNDPLLEQLADRGNGFYTYINDQQDADRVFGHGLTSSLETVARDARVQVEFDPATVQSYRLIGYENRGLADGDFRDPEVDAGEVGAGLTVTALYEVEPWRQGDGHIATVRLRWLDPASGAEERLTQDIELGDLTLDYERSAPHFRLAATVAAFGEVLRDNPWAGYISLRDVANEAASIRELLYGDPDVAEFARLTEIASRLSRER